LDISTETMLDKVNNLEKELTKLPQAECPVWNIFAPGIYIRKMLIKKGQVLTGAVHKTEHLCIVSGSIQVTTDKGIRFICDQQYIFKSMPGTKRAGFALADTYWSTVHATNETDLEKLVEELTESKLSELIGGKDNKQLLENKLQGIDHVIRNNCR
jgi:hypothetical protein